MSTSYYVKCNTCQEAVTDPNDCDNHPDIPRCIIDNIIAYAHVSMMLAELPAPEHGWIEYEIKISGFHLRLDKIRKHCTHSLSVFDEYDREVPPNHHS